MDQLERVRSLLKKVTYKPGWKFGAASAVDPYEKPKPWDWERVIITIIAPMPNLSGKDKTVDVVSNRHFDCQQLARMKDGDIIGYIFTQVIRDLELHEMDEWFKVDGFHVRDPHPENKSVKKLDKQLTTV